MDSLYMKAPNVYFHSGAYPTYATLATIYIYIYFNDNHVTIPYRQNKKAPYASQFSFVVFVYNLFSSVKKSHKV